MNRVLAEGYSGKIRKVKARTAREKQVLGEREKVRGKMERNGKVIGKPLLYATAELETAMNPLTPAAPVMVFMDGRFQQDFPNFLNARVVGIPPRPTIYAFLYKVDSEVNLISWSLHYVDNYVTKGFAENKKEKKGLPVLRLCFCFFFLNYLISFVF